MNGSTYKLQNLFDFRGKFNSDVQNSDLDPGKNNQCRLLSFVTFQENSALEKLNFWKWCTSKAE